jgi:hypothetical protein
MSNEFKIKIKTKTGTIVNIDYIKFNKLFLKIKGKNNKGEIFNSKIIISLSKKFNKIIIGDFSISELEIINSFEELSYNEFRKIYSNNLPSLSSSSSLSEKQNLKNIYKELNIFVKNIKFNTENNKINSIYFTLNNTNIQKIKLRGKII